VGRTAQEIIPPEEASDFARRLAILAAGGTLLKAPYDSYYNARQIVAAEVAEYLSVQRMAEVTPTVTALRQRAADVVEAELLRLENRLPGLDDGQRVEVARTVRRVVDKLLHAPTVRVKQLASAPGGDTYAEALRELFELDPQAVDAVAAGELPLAAAEFDPSRRDGAE
ncbi:MAG TPA: hypothetical protein PLI79_24815, partial [Mycobacterium sp.]|nr:hypothetical protein [Mycobacterium sp.]